MTNRRRTRTATVAVALALGMSGLAACSSSASGPKVAQAQDRSASSAAPTTAPADTTDPVKWAACMRENGMQVEDPKPGGGPISMGQVGSGDLAQVQAKMEAAMKACQRFMPVQGGPGGMPEEAKKQMLQVASCMRTSGFPAFPDPDFSKGGAVTLGSPEVAVDPKYPAALEACMKTVGVGGPGGGAPGSVGSGNGSGSGATHG